jgi:hypothetical protein
LLGGAIPLLHCHAERVSRSPAVKESKHPFFPGAAWLYGSFDSHSAQDDTGALEASSQKPGAPYSTVTDLARFLG